MKDRLKSWISDYKIIAILFFTFALIASLQAYFISVNNVDAEYTKYNNFKIFKHSFFHLIENKDLYILHLEDYFDLYKYTPTFSVFFSAMAYLPEWLGLSVWNIINAGVLFLAIYFLPKLNTYQKGLICVICLLELLTSMQNSQANGLMAGLFVLAFGLLEKKHFFWATACIMISVFIKLFGIVGFALFLLYKPKLRLLIYTLITGLFLAITPLIFISLEQYNFLIESYIRLLSNDHQISAGYSVMGLINTWLSITVNKSLVVGIGALVFILPFFKIKSYTSFNFKALILSSILLWVIIFNHKAESPTFIIAMAGVALWFIVSEKSKKNIFLFIFAMVLTSLSPTDLFPRYIRDNYVNPLALKALPCVLIWIDIIIQLLKFKSSHLQSEKELKGDEYKLKIQDVLKESSKVQ